MNQDVYILVDGGAEVGLGHVARCTSIYDACQDVGATCEFIINGDGDFEGLLTDRKYRVLDWLANHEKLFETIGGAEAVFIDSYLAKRQLYEAVASVVKTGVYLDDFMRIEYPKGFVLNGAIAAEQMNYPTGKDVTYLLGTRYTPLREPFWSVPAITIRPGIETIMVTSGGTDEHNHTAPLLEFLAESRPNVHKKIIVAKSFQNISDIEEHAADNTELIYSPDAAEMKQAMLESDIAISACGQTLYELARVGVPAIGLSMSDDQAHNAEGWSNAGFLEYAGMHNAPNLHEEIGRAVNKLAPNPERAYRSQIGRDYIDGQGIKRVIERISLGTVSHRQKP